MDIKKLIDKFMSGTSSLEEEQMLANYFRHTEDIPRELDPYRKMFGYFDGGMADDTLLAVGSTNLASTSTDSINGGKTVYLHRILYIAASVAVLFVVAYNIICGDEDKGKQVANVVPALVQKADADTVKETLDSIRNVGEQQNESVPERRIPRKYRYKPAAPEVLTAKLQTSAFVDSIDGAANKLADSELRKVEFEQQYILNMIKAVNLIHAVDIAEVADEEVY